MNENAQGKSKKIAALLKLIPLLIILVGIPAYLYFRHGDLLFSRDSAAHIIDYLLDHQSTAALIIIAIQAFQVVVCILPGQPIQFAASYMFGVLGGLALSLVGAVIGVVISFFTAKVLGHDAVRVIFGEKRVSDYQRKLNSSRGLSIAFLIYLIPGVPKDLVSYVAGISNMKFIPFLGVATIGRIPGMAGSLLVGYFFSKGNYVAVGIVCVAVAIMLLVCFVKRKAIINMLDEMEARSKKPETTSGKEDSGQN